MELDVLKIKGGAIYNDNKILSDSIRGIASSWDYESFTGSYNIQSVILTLWN